MKEDVTITKNNFWSEVERVGSTTYKEHWKKHMVKNIAYIAYKIAYKLYLSFFFLFPGFIGAFILMGFVIYGADKMIFIIAEVTQVLFSIENIDILKLFWLSGGGLIFLISLSSIDSLASREKERVESIFIKKHLYVLSGEEAENDKA